VEAQVSYGTRLIRAALTIIALVALPRFAWAQNPPIEVEVNPLNSPDTVPSPAGGSFAFQVILVNATSSVTAQVNATCSGVVSNCQFPNLGGTQENITLVPGPQNVTMNFTVSAVGSGTLTLKVTLLPPAPNVITSGSATIVYDPAGAVTVTPQGGSPVTYITNLPNDTLKFTVTNLELNADTALLQCTAPAVTNNCATLATLPIASKQAITVPVVFATHPQTGSGEVQLSVKMKNTLHTATGFYNINVVERRRGFHVIAASSLKDVPAGTPLSLRFILTNTGNYPDTVTVSASCKGSAVTGACTAAPSSPVPMNVGVSVFDSILTTAGSTVGSTGLVSLAAHLTSATGVRDSAATDVTIQAVRSVGVEIAAINNESRQSPSLCLEESLRRGVAYSCGNLRIAHTLPSITTYDKRRTPTLLYNSQLAHPHPIIHALITLDATKGTPDSVVGQVLDGSGKTLGHSTTWNGLPFANGGTRHVAIGFDYDSATNEYSWSFQARAFYGGMNGTNVAYTTGVFYALVNASKSHLGKGWTIAGVEALHIYSCRCSLLWSSGDGSAAFYSAVSGSPNLFVPTAGPLTRPDTIKSDDSTGHLRYVRYAQHGTHVIFDSTGRHIQTRDRLGHITKIKYANAIDVDSITVPVPNDTTGLVYAFTYGTSGYLTGITAPATRLPNGATQPQKVTVAINGSGDVTSISDPDSSVVQFGYGGSDSDVVMSYTDRLNALTQFTYDAARELSSAITDPKIGGLNITKAFSSGDVGLLSFASAPDSVGIEFDGPTSGFTVFWLNRFGQPVRVRNALGYETNVTMGNATYPALETRAHLPNGQIVGAKYNSRGNLVMEADSSAPSTSGSGFDTTSYTWDSTFDFATQIIAPMQNSITRSYDPVTGNLQWEQYGSDATTQTTFTYDPALGLVTGVTEPQTASTQIQYDAMGNRSASRSPLGYWTLYAADSLGRDTLITSPINAADLTETPAGFAREKRHILYSHAGHVVSDETDGPMLGAALPLSKIVTSTYDGDGHVRSVTRSSSPDVAHVGGLMTQYTFDVAGRQIAVTQPDLTVEHLGYDPAGNVIADTTRRGFIITNTYDVLNHLSTRSIPAVPYTPWKLGIANQTFGNIQNTTPDSVKYGELTVPGDTLAFTYDAVGHMIEADNTMAHVSRAYLTGGELASETQAVRTIAPIGSLGDFTEHVYTVAYSYDDDRRRASITHPTQFTSQTNGTPLVASAYGYDPLTGRLASISDPLSNIFQFRYSKRGDPDTTIDQQIPAAEYRGFDGDGNLITHQIDVTDGSGRQLRNTVYTYDARGKMLTGMNTSPPLRDTIGVNYDGLGQVFSNGASLHLFDVSGGDERIFATENFSTDALGNLVVAATTRRLTDPNFGDSTNTQQRTTTFQSTSDRPSYDIDESGSKDSTWYDVGANTQFTWQPSFTVNLGTLRDRASYYAADEKVRFVDYRTLGNPNGSSDAFQRITEEFRYDALGRRVLVHDNMFCANLGQFVVCPLSFVRRTVWDGNQELDEVQVPDTLAEKDLWQTPLNQYANGFDPNPFYGRALYTFGLQLDEPVSVTRVDYADETALGSTQNIGYLLYPPLKISPLWNALNRTDVGVEQCVGTNPQRCPHYTAIPGLQAYNVLPQVGQSSWLGSLLEHKLDQSQTFYRRNREYDPVTGRFSQEDPIGLGGGLSAYGFAAGDPISFSDPFGLCPYTGSVRTLTLSDCPNDARLAAFALLQRNALGRSFIKFIASQRMNITLTKDIAAACQVKNATGCTDNFNWKMWIKRQQSTVDMAVTIVHETQHTIDFEMQLSAPWIKPHSFATDEIFAYSSGFTFLNTLSTKMRNGSAYASEALMYEIDPGTGLHEVCTVRGYPDCP
jgi:RHS repeat-associated protein